MFRPGESGTREDRDRIVNLSDGVFAIAITLLVLDIQVPSIPENMVSSQLPGALLSLWPNYFDFDRAAFGSSSFRKPQHFS